ncbi:MAG: cytochrome c [Polyangiales bacterium]
MTSRLAFVALGLSLLLAACGQGDRPRRTWRPEDHSQPEGVGGSPAQAPAAQAEAEAAPEGDPRLRAAVSLFRIRCAGCHGPEGHGNGPERMPAMQPPDFASAEWQASRSDAELAASIASGKNLMPPFGEEIGADGIAALVALVRAMRAP